MTWQRMARWTGALVAGMLLLTALAPAAQAHWDWSIQQDASCSRGDTDDDFSAVANADGDISKIHNAHGPTNLFAKARAEAESVDRDEDEALAVNPTDTDAHASASVDELVDPYTVVRADAEVEANPVLPVAGMHEDPPAATASCEDAATENLPDLPSVPGTSLVWDIDPSACKADVTVNGQGISITCTGEGL